MNIKFFFIFYNNVYLIKMITNFLKYRNDDQVNLFIVTNNKLLMIKHFLIIPLTITIKSL